MKRLLISTAAVALMTTAGLAADLPVYEPPPVVEAVPSVYDWSGFYLGLHVGGAFLTDDDDADFVYNGGFFATGAGTICGPTGCPTSVGDDGDDGFLAGGAHAGWQGQWGMWVAGIEVDVTYLDLDDDDAGIVRASNAGFFGVNTFTDTFQTTGFNDDDEENNLLGTVRGRLGVAFDRVLVYGTGGLALTSSENTEGFVGFGQGFNGPAPAAPFFAAFSDPTSDDDDDIALGFAAGGGIELAVTDHFIVGAEALYFNIEGDDDDSDTLTCNAALSTPGVCGGAVPAGTTVTVTDENAFEGVIARVRGSYKF